MGECNDCGITGIIHGPAALTLCLICYDDRIRRADRYVKVRALKDFVLELRVLEEKSP